MTYKSRQYTGWKSELKENGVMQMVPVYGRLDG